MAVYLDIQAQQDIWLWDKNAMKQKKKKKVSSFHKFSFAPKTALQTQPLKKI